MQVEISHRADQCDLPCRRLIFRGYRVYWLHEAVFGLKADAVPFAVKTLDGGPAFVAHALGYEHDDNIAVINLGAGKKQRSGRRPECRR